MIEPRHSYTGSCDLCPSWEARVSGINVDAALDAVRICHNNKPEHKSSLVIQHSNDCRACKTAFTQVAS
jgi:hypothetical protein